MKGNKKVWELQFDKNECDNYCEEQFSYLNASLSVCKRGCQFGTQILYHDNGFFKARTMCQVLASQLLSSKNIEYDKFNHLDDIHYYMFPDTPENVYKACLLGIRQQIY